MVDFNSQRRLGQTNLHVTPLGLAASYGIEEKDVLRANEKGINLFYWGSARTSGFGKALKQIGQSNRDKNVVVIQTYVRWASGVESSLTRALKELHYDYADILLLGWWNKLPKEAILDAAAEQVAKGKAKAVMVSCHHRPTFAQLARDPRIQLLMCRYNAAHPGAEKDMFPHLPDPRPGVIAYTATSWGQLLDPSLTPAGDKTPTSTDCYRFAMSSPFVDCCYTGPKNGAELDLALEALQKGPLSEDERQWMLRVGANVHANATQRTGGMKIADKLIDWIS